VAVSFARRLALACQQKSGHAPGPSLGLLLRELAALPGLVPGLKRPPPVALSSRPSLVMIVPGFLANAAMMFPMVQGLSAAGHEVCEWGMGTNFGPSAELLAELPMRIDALAERSGRPVALVGWSLGGLVSREAARATRPGSVRLIVTMGTPFSGDRRANNAWRLYQLVAGHDVDHPPVSGDIALKPPVRTVALWSRRDGIVAPAAARGMPGESDEAVELDCLHMAFPSDPEAIREVLRQLDREN
jgi:pimeloyl-ACP methyl ester carboxylesterase